MSKKERTRIGACLVIAAVCLIIVGLIGVSRTFSSYGVVAVGPFAGYLAFALTTELVGIGLGVHGIDILFGKRDEE
jgi:hypothetical protein